MDLPSLIKQVERALDDFNTEYRTPLGQTLTQAGIGLSFVFGEIKRVGEKHAEIEISCEMNKARLTTADKTPSPLKYGANPEFIHSVGKLIGALDTRKMVEDQLLYRRWQASRGDSFFTANVIFSTTLKVI